MDIFVFYVLPNIALFGGIYAVCKLFEHAWWYVICNYDNVVNKLQTRG